MWIINSIKMPKRLYNMSDYYRPKRSKNMYDPLSPVIDIKIREGDLLAIRGFSLLLCISVEQRPVHDVLEVGVPSNNPENISF